MILDQSIVNFWDIKIKMLNIPANNIEIDLAVTTFKQTSFCTDGKCNTYFHENPRSKSDDTEDGVKDRVADNIFIIYLTSLLFNNMSGIYFDIARVIRVYRCDVTPFQL